MMRSSSPRAAGWIFACALLVLLAGEVLRIYWIMPFPGSQRGATLGFAYALHRAIWVLRIVAGAAALVAAAQLVARGGRVARIATIVGLIAIGVVAYEANGPMSADVMFRPPSSLTFSSARDLHAAQSPPLPPSALVVGLVLVDSDGVRHARAYPIRYIGYHHQVRDEVAGQPVLVTYCTVCRTGRVFRPVVRGKVESFRLVGMDHWNAMFEDATTGSWWRQATGEAVAGPLLGERLEEIPSHQMTWSAWAAAHPATDLMNPDPRFTERYEHMAGFDEGTNESRLTGRDPESWREKSWVVGVVAGGQARAFDWNDLVHQRALSDRVGDQDIVLLLAADGASFMAFEAPGLDLVPTADLSRFVDRDSGRAWTAAGIALDGAAGGADLQPLPAYQEFWHSWRTFHPETTARRD